MSLTVEMPVIFCNECNPHNQIVTYPFRIVGTDTLIDMWCAIERGKNGLAHTVAPLEAKAGGFVPGHAGVMSEVDAIALLVRNGATIL